MPEPFTLSEIQDRISRFGGPPDYETEQALSYAIALIDGTLPSDPAVPFEVIGRAVQFRPRFCEYVDPHDGVCYAGSEQGGELCSFEYSQRCSIAKQERWSEEVLIRNWEEQEANYNS